MTNNLRLTGYGPQKCALSEILLKGGQCLLDYTNILQIDFQINRINRLIHDHIQNI